MLLPATWLLLLVSHRALAGPSLPSQTCEVLQACEVHEDNLVEDLEGVESAEECKQLCSDSTECNMFSHFGSSSSPLHNHCLLLRSCPSLHDCDDCLTKSKVCFGGCNQQFEVKVAENEVDTIIDSVDEPSCLQSRRNGLGCKWCCRPVSTRQTATTRTTTLVSRLVTALVRKMLLDLLPTTQGIQTAQREAVIRDGASSSSASFSS